MKRKFPRWLLLAAFVLVPLVEIYVIIQVGQAIGPWWTILLLIADSVLGSWLVKREGARAWRALRSALDEGRMPATELADGMLILVGGLLMLTPGFVLDIVGAFCILPFTRPIGRRALAGFVSRRLTVTAFPGAASYGGGAPAWTGPDLTVAPDRMWSEATSSTEAAARAWAQALVFLRGRWRCAGPISPPRSSSRRSVRMSSSSLTERRSSSMSQCVRTGFSAFTSGLIPSTESASAPQRGHSHTAGISASVDMVISNRCPCGHA